MRNKQIIALALIGLVLGGFGWVAVSSGQTTPGQGDSQTVKALLDEVRQLRLVLQRNSVATYRAQVTLERLKLQQGIVAKLLEEQEQLRRNIRSNEQSLPHQAEQVTEIEKIVALAKTPEERIDREMAVRDFKKEMERRKQELQDLREREPQVAARVQTEQAKLSELNESLDKLERELETGVGIEKGKRP